MYFFYFCNDLINCKTLVHCYIINNRDVKQLVKHEQACFILTDSFDGALCDILHHFTCLNYFFWLYVTSIDASKIVHGVGYAQY